MMFVFPQEILSNRNHQFAVALLTFYDNRDINLPPGIRRNFQSFRCGRRCGSNNRNVHVLGLCGHRDNTVG